MLLIHDLHDLLYSKMNISFYFLMNNECNDIPDDNARDLLIQSWAFESTALEQLAEEERSETLFHLLIIVAADASKKSYEAMFRHFLNSRINELERALRDASRDAFLRRDDEGLYRRRLQLESFKKLKGKKTQLLTAAEKAFIKQEFSLFEERKSKELNAIREQQAREAEAARRR